jgi:hypothetical protein
MDKFPPKILNMYTFIPELRTMILNFNILKLPAYSLAGFDRTTHCSDLLGGKRR